MDIFWSIGIVPIGILACLTPALVVYWLTSGENAIGNDTAPQSSKSAGKRKGE
jgi:hypothetical protein